MRIAILGTGLMGSALGTLWARADHSVTFSYSRDQHKLLAVSRAAGGASDIAPPADAVSESEVVLVAVPWHRLDDVIAAAGGGGCFAHRVVVTCSLPMTPDDSGLAVGRTTSGAEELARRAPEARVVAAFNTIPSELLHAEVLARRPRERPEVVHCGDDAAAKEIVAGLVRDAGCEPVDAGPLRVARYMEPFGLLVAQLAYEQGLGPELGYRWLRYGAGETK